MTRRSPARLALLLLALGAASAVAAQEPPATDVPDAPATDLEPSANAPTHSPSSDLGTGRRIPIGAYGEVHLIHQGNQTEATLRRFVLFVGHSFTDWARLYSEIEIEDGHEIEVEQAYLELSNDRRIGLRAGLLVLPLGIINQLHEPPTFNGVERPLVDQLVIPTTWREIGAGVFGDVLDGVAYQLYVVNGLDAARFSATYGIGPGRGQGAESKAEDAAVTGRIDYNRLLGLDLGAGFYFGGAGQRTDDLGGATVALLEADARYARDGVELRAEYARVFISGADRITAYQRALDPAAPAIASALQGFYGEAGYDVLRLVTATEQQLVAFARYENVDMRAAVPAVLAAGGPNVQQYLTAGLTYRPHPQIVFKADYRRRLAGQEVDPDQDPSPHRFSLGIGFMY